MSRSQGSKWVPGPAKEVRKGKIQKGKRLWALVRELRRRERLPRSSGRSPMPGRNPLQSHSRGDLGTGKVLSSEVSSHDALPPTSWAPIPSAPPPPAARPVPEAETDPGPAPLSSTAPGRVRQGEGGRRGPPLAWPASAPGTRQPQVTLAEDQAWGWSWRDRAGDVWIAGW